MEKMEQQEGMLPGFILGEEMPGYDLPFWGRAFFYTSMCFLKSGDKGEEWGLSPKKWLCFFQLPIWSVFCLQIVSNTSTIYKEGIMYASLSPCKVGRVGVTWIDYSSLKNSKNDEEIQDFGRKFWKKLFWQTLLSRLEIIGPEKARI